MDSTITIVGNLARDPELRFTPSGQAIASFGVAVNRRFQKNGQWEESVSFIDVACWGTLGENVAESLAKGDRVIVAGRMEQQSWEDKEGNKRSKLQIVADCAGPDMRWANATVVKNDRREGGDSRAPAAAAAGPAVPDDPGF